MPIYRATIRGSDETPRLVRAETAAQARNHVVIVAPLTAEQMADAIEAGATIEKATASPAD